MGALMLVEVKYQVEIYLSIKIRAPVGYTTRKVWIIVTYIEYTLEYVTLSECNMAYLISCGCFANPLASFIAYMYETLCGIKTFHMSIIILQSIFQRISYRMSKYQSRQLRHKNIIGHGPYINILILQCF